MDESTWDKYAKKYKGVLVNWFDQSTDPALNEINSRGVCFAMALDFVTAYRMGQPGPYNLVNTYRDFYKASGGKKRIPEKYIKIQAALREMTNQYETVMNGLKNAEKTASNKAEIEAAKTARIKLKYGPGMTNFKLYKDDKSTANKMPKPILKTINDLDQNAGPAYYLVTMNTGNSYGHAIAFGHRYDLEASTNFLSIYTFFDANLGFFTFGSQAGLENFFTKKVWKYIYGKFKYPYTNGMVAMYPADMFKR